MVFVAFLDMPLFLGPISFSFGSPFYSYAILSSTCLISIPNFILVFSLCPVISYIHAHCPSFCLYHQEEMSICNPFVLHFCPVF